MTPKERFELITHAARTDMIAYACALNNKYEPGAFHRLLGKTLDYAFSDDPMAPKRIMAFAPPRHGKSEIFSHYAPSHFMGKFPDRKVIAASHTAMLAEGFGGKIRNNLKHPLHTGIFGPKAGLDPLTTSRANFKTVVGGEFFAVGVGGTPIGKGGDLIVIDDPIRSRAEAESALYRENLKAWYSSSLYTRLEGKDILIVMHQRWHEDDLAGWLINEHKHENWLVLNFPALATSYDELGRVPGEALWPERFDEDKLEMIMRTQSPRDFLSMYQQSPRSQEGDEFQREMFQRYTKPAEMIRHSMNVYIVVDSASSKKKNSDRTAMLVIGLGADGNYYLLDFEHGRFNLLERTQKLIELHKKWKPHKVGYERYGQMSDIEHIRSHQEAINYRFPIIELGGSQPKPDRIRRLIPDMMQSKWYFMESKYIKDEGGVRFDALDRVIEQEFIPFPVAAYVDFPDAMSRIYDIQAKFPERRAVSLVDSNSEAISPW